MYVNAMLTFFGIQRIVEVWGVVCWQYGSILEVFEGFKVPIGGAGALKSSILGALGRHFECFGGHWAPFCELWGSLGCHGWFPWHPNSDLGANR